MSSRPIWDERYKRPCHTHGWPTLACMVQRIPQACWLLLNTIPRHSIDEDNGLRRMFNPA